MLQEYQVQLDYPNTLITGPQHIHEIFYENSWYSVPWFESKTWNHTIQCTCIIRSYPVSSDLLFGVLITELRTEQLVPDMSHLSLGGRSLVSVL